MRVVELFAGVGGFKIGFEGPPGESYDSPFKVIWANQWEPSTKRQHAAEIYSSRWGMKQEDDDPEIFHGDDEIFVNKDISGIDANEIPDHDLLCGGFPCQDYSVAKTSNKAAGIAGKKGVLWWQIHRILSEKKPDYVLLENVDRLLKSPTAQRGRDFAVMLASLDELGYAVEWREFPASEYGFPQRRRRVYILAYMESSTIGRQIKSPEEWIKSDGVFARAFPIEENFTFGLPSFNLRKDQDDDLADVSSEFNLVPGRSPDSPFLDAGIMISGQVWNTDYRPSFSGTRSVLRDVLVDPASVPDEYLITAEDLLREKGWIYLKGAKSEPRKRGDYEYHYKEGPVTFPDDLDRPSRTIITGEGGSGASRFKHVVEFMPEESQRDRLELDSESSQLARARLGLSPESWVRRLTPVELERLNMFPDGHTEGVGDGRRAFLMGNALVIGVIERISRQLARHLESE